MHDSSLETTTKQTETLKDKIVWMMYLVKRVYKTLFCCITPGPGRDNYTLQPFWKKVQQGLRTGYSNSITFIEIMISINSGLTVKNHHLLPGLSHSVEKYRVLLLMYMYVTSEPCENEMTVVVITAMKTGTPHLLWSGARWFSRATTVNSSVYRSPVK